MEKYKIIGKTNGWIAQRDIHFNGKCEITIESGLTLDEAVSKLSDMFCEDYGYYPERMEVGFDEDEQPIYDISPNWHYSGTVSYEFDSRYYYIVSEDED